MELPMVTFSLLILQILLPNFVHGADGGVEKLSPTVPPLAESLKEFVTLKANVHAYGFNDKYGRMLKKIVANIDKEIEVKLQDLSMSEVHLLKIKNLMLTSTNKMHLYEAHYRDRQAPDELFKLQKNTLRLGRQYHEYRGRHDLFFSLIEVTRQIRTLINDDLDAHIMTKWTGDLKSGEIRLSNYNTEKVLLRLAPLVQMALRLTQKANAMLKMAEAFNMPNEALNQRLEDEVYYENVATIKQKPFDDFAATKTATAPAGYSKNTENSVETGNTEAAKENPQEMENAKYADANSLDNSDVPETPPKYDPVTGDSGDDDYWEAAHKKKYRSVVSRMLRIPEHWVDMSIFEKAKEAFAELKKEIKKVKKNLEDEHEPEAEPKNRDEL